MLHINKFFHISSSLITLSFINNCGVDLNNVHFWPSNYCPSLILTMQLQNRVSLTIKLSKPFTFGHPVALQGGFGDVADTW